MSEKKPRLVYYEEGESCWCPAPERIETLVDITSDFLSHGEVIEISFKRVDMTDEEWGNLPEDER